MSMQLTFALVNGLTVGMSIFLVAAGLTLVFGILRILNFAHGGFFMIGAYLTFSFLQVLGDGLAQFLLASLAAGVVVAGIGIVTDRIVLRRLKDLDEEYMLIGTFGLLMVCVGAVKLIWGLDYHSVSPPSEVSGILRFGNLIVSKYSLFIVAMGLVVFFALEFAIHRLWIGKIVQSLANDGWMTGLLGLNVPLLFTGVVIVAFALAGLAGGLLLPNQSLSPELGHAYTLNAFIAVIIGGLGNIRGALFASLILGITESMSSFIIPGMPGLAIYVVMIVLLFARPNGLFHRGVS
ncbi:branched-chain amino acid ABC transporter permease [Phaeovulum sp. NW3]|nr:branched-chain amino acid ABC transporter permease [Phaeovulum sp. NW3]